MIFQGHIKSYSIMVTIHVYYHIQFVDPIDFNKRQSFDMNGVDSDE